MIILVLVADMEKAQALADLETSFPCGTLAEAQQAYKKARTFGASPNEIEEAVREGQETMHAIMAATP